MHPWFTRTWATLREPRVVTAAMVAIYVVSAVCGIGMVTRTVPVILSWPLGGIEGGILIAAGLIGAPSAWRGCWLWERVGLIGFGGVGVVLLVATLLEAWADILQQDITASWVIGTASWVVLAITRWVRIKDRPYAPGRGPVPISVREREALLALYLAGEAERIAGREGE